MNYYGSKLNTLIEELSKLPGIGGKSAQRIAFHIIALPPERVKFLADAIFEAKQTVKYCNICCNLTDTDVCPVCNGKGRDLGTIMVVESPRDLAAYEKTRKYRGVYHVLHGAISPLTGVSPDELRIKELLARLTTPADEIILATNPTVEGEATALYLSKLIKPLGIKCTRIARGVPVGGDLEYVDEVTLYKALEGRMEI